MIIITSKDGVVDEVMDEAIDKVKKSKNKTSSKSKRPRENMSGGTSSDQSTQLKRSKKQYVTSLEIKEIMADEESDAIPTEDNANTSTAIFNIQSNKPQASNLYY